MPNHPLYRYDPLAVLRLAFNLLFGGRRSFRRDAISFIRGIRPPLSILGAENIPQTGPCLITFNHYFRPGFGAWWMALALAATVPVDMHFVMTGELTYPGKWYSPVGRPISRWVLKRVAQVYGFTTSPPMPPRPRDVEARAHSVRRLLEFARSRPQAVIGLAPEGGDQPDGVLSLPPPGSGRFISLLAGMGFRIVPVGVCEENGCLFLNFGQSTILPVPRGKSADEKDRLAAETVMRRIAALIPERLRGDFSQ